MSPNVFEINEDDFIKIHVLVNFMQCFFLLCKRKICRTSKKIAGPVDLRCYWSYGASNILS